MELNKIHSDARGTIYLLKGFNELEEVTVFETNAGYSRGGCIHRINDEHCCIVEGKVSYSIGNDVRNYSTGDKFIIPKGTPHYFTALTDCVVLEWGASAEEKKEKHREFRTQVDILNKFKGM